MSFERPPVRPELARLRVTLKPSDEEELQASLLSIINDLASDSPEVLNKLAEDLLGFSRVQLLRLCQLGDDRTKSSLQHFCRSNLSIQTTLNKRLSKNISLNFQTMDKAREYTVFDLYLASFFAEASMDAEQARLAGITREQALDYGCELGSLHALELSFKRATDNIVRLDDESNISTTKNSADEFTEVTALAKELANHYWALGYAKAGCRLYVLGQFLKAKGENKQGIHYCEQAIKNILCSASLNNNPDSDRITKSALKTKTLIDLYNAFFKEHELDLHFTDNQEIPKLCNNLIDRTSYQIASKAAELEIATLLIHLRLSNQPSRSLFVTRPDDQTKKTQRTEVISSKPKS